MLTFKSLLKEEKNTHMVHIEDKVIHGGVKGAREAILALRSLRDMLAGRHASNVSVKWDGAPAIFCGTDPRDGKFFVAKKGIFNKTPKVYKTPADIDADTSGDLSTKLKLALKYLPDLGIKGVIQGDFLYGPGDLKTKKIKGESYLTFHPNTIVYAIPAGTRMAQNIRSKKIGIVWHTRYTGKSFETMKASYGVNIKALKKSKHVWSEDAMLRDLTNYTLSKKDTDSVYKHLKTAGYLFNRIASTTLRQLEQHHELIKVIDVHTNMYVRSGSMPPNSKKRVAALLQFINTRYKKEIAARKTLAGKQTQQRKLDNILNFFSPKNKQSLENMFDLQKEIILAKLILINRLSKLSKVKTFLKTKNGYRTTNEEGYVAIDKLGGDAVKIVDRLEFSYANFSPDILKGWDNPGRN